MIRRNLFLGRAGFPAVGSPIFGGERNSPEIWRWSDEFDAHLKTPAFGQSLIHHPAQLGFVGPHVFNKNLLDLVNRRHKQNQRAMRVYRQSFRGLGFGIGLSGSPLRNHLHTKEKALASPLGDTAFFCGLIRLRHLRALAKNNLFAMAQQPARSISRIHHKLCGFDDRRIVVAGVVGGDNHAVITGERLRVQRN